MPSARAHRAHASIVGVTRHLPSAAGFLLEREVDALGRILSSQERPLAAVLGGAKVSDKIGVLENLLGKLDLLLVGGGMAATFLKAQGHEVGDSLGGGGANRGSQARSWPMHQPPA